MLMRALPIVLVVSLCSAAPAGQIERAWVDPEATWLVHIDFEGLMASQLFQGVAAQNGVDLRGLERELRAEIHRGLAEDSDIPPHVLQTWHDADFSFIEDVRSITVFGLDANEEPSAVILQTTGAIDRIVASLDPIEGINVAQGENVSFVALREPGTPAGDPEREHVAAIRRNPATNDRTIVIADTTAQLISALELFARQSARGAAGGPEWASARPGTYLLLHASADGLAHINDEASRILGQAERVHLEAGEDAGRVYVDALLQARDAETINNVVAIAQGVMAAGRLGLSGKPEARELINLLNAVRVGAQGATMTVSFQMEAQRLMQMMESLQELHDSAFDIHHSHETHEHEVEIEVEIE